MRRRLVREGVAVTELGALIYSALDHNLKKVGGLTSQADKTYFIF
jgi:hypothetical protein